MVDMNAYDLATGSGDQPVIWKKFKHYNVETDPEQDDKAKELLLCSAQRPHCRAFQLSWISFFLAFFMWFSIVPLLPHIQKDLDLTKQEIWTSTIAGVGGTILVRLILGPLCDVFGPRRLFSLVLIIASIPTACTGLVNNATELAVLRAFIGISGGTFVMCEFWSSRMFTKEIVGTANALTAGWGNLGGGVTHLVMGVVLYPLFTAMFHGDAEKAWRTVCIVPAVVGAITGVMIYFYSDDSPKGNYSELKAHGMFPPITAAASFKAAAFDRNTWLLAVQYACSFGMELTMTSAASMFFKDHYGLSTEAAGSLAAVFGWLNLFARGAGGALSDICMQRFGMRGRLWIQTFCLIGEGCFVLIFSQSNSLGGSICSLVIFSLFVQAADGTCFGIVPYVNPRYMGSVIGIVGAGGNVGGVCFGLAFRQLPYETAFLIVGGTVLGSSLLSSFINIAGHRSLFFGRDQKVNPETGEVIMPSRDATSRSGSRSSGHNDHTEALA